MGYLKLTVYYLDGKRLIDVNIAVKVHDITNDSDA